MTRRLNALLERFGVAGVLGIAVLLACAGFWVSSLKPIQEEVVAQRSALERLRSRAPFRPVAADARAEELRRFQSLFPPVDALTGEIERLHRLARGAGLELAQGEYRLERRAAGLWSYRVSLPARGSYAQMRRFIAAVLQEMPVASLDALRFERKRADEPQLEAQLRLTLHVRPNGDSP